MKKIFTLLCLTTLIFTSCSNDDDIDFDTIAQSFEVRDVNFSPDNQGIAAINVPIPLDIEIFEADVIQVFRLEDVFQGEPVWEPVPTPTIFLQNGGELTYRFNFTINSVDIFLDTPNFSEVGTEFTDNQLFRIVVIPSTFNQDNNIDITDYNALSSALNIDTNNIPTVTF